MNLTHELFEELGELERIPARGPSSIGKQGETIRDALVRHLPFPEVAVYLRDARGDALLRAATTPGLRGPETLGVNAVRAADTAALFDPPALVVPIASAKTILGAIAVGVESHGTLAPESTSELRTVASYISAFLSTNQLESELREGDFQMRYRVWELESLYDIGLSIASMLDLEQLSDEILMRTVSLVNARRAALYLRRGDRFALHQTLGGARAQFLDEEITDDAAKRLFEDGIPLHFENAGDCIFPDCKTLVAMPIRGSANDVIGVLAAADREYRDGSVGGFDENEIQLLSRFANQVSIALQNAKLHKDALDKQAMDRDLELAATIQSNILPRALPSLDGFEVSVLHNPARQLGGDYHAFFEHDGNLTTCVADVSGKSIPAAILVSALHAALQLLFHEGRELGDITTELNRHIHRWSSESKFITMVLATIDRRTNTVRYVNAGHNPAYVIHDGTIETLHSHGLPVGILGASRYETQVGAFPKGSLLVLYSDGINEASSVADEEFGNDRLTDLLLEHQSDSTAKIRDAIRTAVIDFAGERPQYDDQTVVLVRTS